VLFLHWFFIHKGNGGFVVAGLGKCDGDHEPIEPIESFLFPGHVQPPLVDVMPLNPIQAFSLRDRIPYD
jgi:hypothetical protein